MPPSADRPLRWGVVGPGRIAANVCADFPLSDRHVLAAVASRSADRAADFAARFGASRSYGSYRELVADDGVDAVYIATPHPQHAAIAVAALEAGRPVLVEKAFTATAAGTRTVIETARRTGVFAMEAMWTRFQPAVVTAHELVDAGTIGDVVSVQADLGVTRDFDPSDRIFAADLGGGALLDLGVYVTSMAQDFLGTPDTVHATGPLEPNGVDAGASLLLGYADGRSATLMCSLHSPMPGHARIFGSTGWIDIQPRFHHPRAFVLHRGDREPERIEAAPTGTGYLHEFDEVARCLAQGLTESPVMPLADTQAVMDVLDQACTQLGVRYAEDADALG